MINLPTFLYQESIDQSSDWSEEEILVWNLAEDGGRSLFLKLCQIRVDVLKRQERYCRQKDLCVKSQGIPRGLDSAYRQQSLVIDGDKKGLMLFVPQESQTNPVDMVVGEAI
jgi:hypothetical protein